MKQKMVSLNQEHSNKKPNEFAIQLMKFYASETDTFVGIEATK